MRGEKVCIDTVYFLIVVDMSEEDRPPKVLRFLNDYRKKLSLLKIKSFYTNHLCKKNCLEGRLQQNNETCMKECD